MRFNVSCELEYNLNSAATFLFALKCIQTGGQNVLEEYVFTEPEVHMEEFHIESGMNRFSRIETFYQGTLSVSYRALVDVSYRIDSAQDLSTGGSGELTPEAIPFLFPSRYCQSDRIRQQANAMFGHLRTPYEIASVVSDWIFENIAYVSGSSGETSSAVDTMETRQGVCRDFAHLGIAFCRALDVPARYATVYAYQLNPPDFHACFEVLIGGWWYIFDPTRLAPLNGLIRIATGRDAADAAVCTIFGDPVLTRSEVFCGLADSGFYPVTRDSLMENQQVIALL
ncbi:MAG: transglutaminase family protein [Akkermansiaceae bacterium]|jgi:transglutaminase-like putative cysteine protease|nr:transglutaminase family protein [Akkermansiaceae bacterium]MDP4646789.1 transglutaminase family protein [Akkermansiaceae bacterium]MDP4720011.1 transglutaminase family protein [Akkermansiaceae bacterium]MDP4779705.1 transglutaminase family protein [Akkermansiaceae bacterium]MDP4846636.1 transglutaminase family protein [Akkermansiaceae bacterium]